MTQHPLREACFRLECSGTCTSCVHASLPQQNLAHLLKQEGGGALATVYAVKVGGHEGTRAALGALLAQALHLARVVHLQDMEINQ